jgi:DUF971 family protein
MDAPTHLHLDRLEGLTVTWSSGKTSHYPVGHLRRWSPSADARHQRQSLADNPLAVVATSSATPDTLEAVSIERVGNYAIRISFNDGHHTGLYSWQWLRSIDPATMASERT